LKEDKWLFDCLVEHLYSAHVCSNECSWHLPDVLALFSKGVASCLGTTTYHCPLLRRKEHVHTQQFIFIMTIFFFLLFVIVQLWPHMVLWSL
jgi:hypothetical protein